VGLQYNIHSSLKQFIVQER